MQIEYIRSSSLGTYESCAFDYYLAYSVGMGSFAGSAALWGTVSHEVLELLAKLKKSGRNEHNSRFVNVDFLLQSVWKRTQEKDERGFVFDEKAYNFCRKTIQKVLDSKYNPLKLNVLDTERQFEIELNAPGFKSETSGRYAVLRGTVDFISELDKDTLLVMDYKTGRRTNWATGKLKELEDLEKDIQFMIYNLALSIIYPQYKYRIFTIYYINDGGPFTISFKPEDTEKCVAMLRQKFNTIQGDNSPLRLKDDDSRKHQRFKCTKVCHWGKTLENGVSLCDKYHQILDVYGLSAATQKLVDLTISAKAESKASPRNDYSHDKMFRGKLRS